MTRDFFDHLLPQIERYYDRHRPNCTRAQWHEAWLKADGFDVDVGESSYTAWFVIEEGDKKKHVRILAFGVRDALFSSDELYHELGLWGVYEDDLEHLLRNGEKEPVKGP